MSIGLIFSAISAVGQLQAGRAAEEEAKLNEFRITEVDKKLNKVEADQAAFARKQEFDSAMSSNIATLAASGRDIGSSMSIKAFLEREQEIAFQDIGRMQNQTHWDGLRSDMESLAERRRGKNERTASLFRATATLGKGIDNYMKTR